MAKKKASKSSFAKTKGNIKKLWKKAKVQAEDAPDFMATVEDGRYIAKLIGAVIKVSATEKAWKHLEWLWEILEGDAEGENIYKRTGLETEDNIMFFIRDLARLDVDTDSLEIDSEKDIEELMEALVEEGVIARLRTRTVDSGFQNVYIDKLIEDYSGGTEEEKTPEEEEPDWSKGDKCSVAIDGEDYEGVIKKVKDDVVTIKFDDGDTDDYELSELQAVEADHGEVNEDLVGKTMGFKEGKKMLVGKILSIDDDTFVMKTDAGKKVSGDIDDLETPEEEEPDWSKGDKCSVAIDGEDYEGVIKKVKDDVVTIKFDDGDTDDYELSELQAVEEESKNEFEIGDRVTAKIDGETYAGEINDIDGDEASVAFDDGEELVITLEDLTEE